MKSSLLSYAYICKSNGKYLYLYINKYTMSNFISTYTIDFNDMKMSIGGSDFVKSSNWENLIMENEGSFSKTCQYMGFDYLGFRVEIGFDMVVSGRHDWDPGDYLNPPTSYCDIDDVDIDVTSFHVDEYEAELTPEIIAVLKKIIDKNL